MATQPAIWFPLQESCGHCPEARGRPRMGGMRLEHGTSHSCLSLQGGHSGPSNHKTPETLVFVCFHVSVLEEAAQKGKWGC